MNTNKKETLKEITDSMPAFLDIDPRLFNLISNLTDSLLKNGLVKKYEDDTESFIEEKINVNEILDGIDEDLKKLMIPILEEVNVLLENNLANESDALYQFNFRIAQYYNEIDVKNLNPNLQKYLKNGISEVENRVFRVLFPNND